MVHYCHRTEITIIAVVSAAMVKVVFVHPDLGIGGAERLVVDAALALKSHGHSVQFFTAHHDPEHCFTETADGTLAVTCVCDWLPRNICGMGHALWAYVRMIFVAWYLVFFSGVTYDVVVCDQISACIPVLKWKGTRVLYYCHFPDQLLTQRRSWLKRMYRMPIDYIEEKTTGMADKVLVNSKFTATVFHETFRSLQHIQPDVLYPSLIFPAFDAPIEGALEDLKLKKEVNTIFLSINRYERKKHLSLALKALGFLRNQVSLPVWQRIHLIIAGGYDTQVVENIEYYNELTAEAEALQLKNKVTFLRSFSDAQKRLLLHSCTCLIYTPQGEHFGIVPLEAMYMSRPVIAVNSGGPTETIVDHQTGFLCDPTPSSFAGAIKKFADDRDLAREMGRAGREHVRENFSFDSFTQKLDGVIYSLLDNEKKD